MVKHILSVDGGGIRGIIPAIILAEIEKRARKPISQLFDLMAGTSTGGIVVAGLCKKDNLGKPKYSANNLVNLYQEYGPYIFKSSFLRRSVFSWLNGAQYSHKNIEYVLHKYFGNTTLEDVSVNLLLTSYDIHNNCPFFFKSWKEDRSFISLKDALRATTAAPTYFQPKYLKVDKIDRVLIDGGVFANNPAACSYASSKKLFPNDDIVLLSIGTGRTHRTIKYSSSRRFGKIGWIKPLLNVIFDSSLDAVNYQLDQVMSDKYIRIQSHLKISSSEMDNVTLQNIKYLQNEAFTVIEGNQMIKEAFTQNDKVSHAEEFFLNKISEKEIQTELIENHPLGQARCQVYNTYIIAQAKDKIIVVDQHAAHERLIYENLKQKSNIKMQSLLMPVIVEVKNQEGMELLEKYVNKLTEIGFNLEINSENQVIVKSIPAILGDINVKEMLLNIIDRLLEIEDTLPMEDGINKILATVACHWSIRAGREMRLDEMNALLRQMEKTPYSGQCNHGRPTYVELKLSDIEKWFERR